MVAVAAPQTERRSAKPRETWEHAIWRLAGEAERHGVLIYRHDNGQCVRYFATSQSHAAELHYVTFQSCDCEGFMRWGRCRHLAALLKATGNMPQQPEPEPPAATSALPCPDCHGTGSAWVSGWGRNGATAHEIPCSRCQGTGEVAAA